MSTCTSDEERLEWIKTASYLEMLRVWRNEPLGSPWFIGVVGEKFAQAISIAKSKLPHSEAVAISKQVGWDEEG